jgi:hypothetical protein
MRTSCVTCAALLCAAGFISDVQAQPGPPIERIESASAVSADAFGAVTNVRELPDGRLLLNDGTRRRLLLLDTAMTVQRVVLDSLSEVAHTYGPRAGTLIPWRGDSTLFIDPAAFAAVVLAPDGSVVRVRSVWRVQDIPFFTNTTGAMGFAGVDARGRVVYRVPAVPAPPAVPPPSNVPYFPPQPDSAFIVAVDLDTRRADTLGVIRIPRVDQRIRQTGDMRFTTEVTTNPLPVTDHWAVLPDGTVAFIRGSDYRIDYLQPDGSLRSTGRIPYDWQRLSDDDKVALVDSTRNALQRAAMNDYTSAMIRWTNMYGRPYPDGFQVPDGYVPAMGFARDWILPPGVEFPATYIYACEPGQEPPAGMVQFGGGMMMQAGGIQSRGDGPPAGGVQVQGGGPPPGGAVQGGGIVRRDTVAGPGGAASGAANPGGATPGGATPGGATPGGATPGGPAGAAAMCLPAPTSPGGAVAAAPTMRYVGVMGAYDLPDFRPALMTGAAGAVRADTDGNLWIRTVPTRPVPGGPVYDVVTPAGELVNRIQLPPGYTIVGFGRDRVVYLTMRDATGLKLARVRLR